MKGLTITILAAGSSSRMGQSKQLMVLEGKTLLQRAISIAKQVNPENVTIVLGANEEAHRKVISNQQVDIVVNSNWTKGMGSSIKTGLHHILRLSPSIECLILMVCDQPYVSFEHLQTMLSKHTSNPQKIIASRYAGTSGVPVLFPKSYFKSLSALDDKSGAKKVLLHHQDQVIPVELPNGEIDLDTPEDFRNLLE